MGKNRWFISPQVLFFFKLIYLSEKGGKKKKGEKEISPSRVWGNAPRAALGAGLSCCGALRGCGAAPGRLLAPPRPSSPPPRPGVLWVARQARPPPARHWLSAHPPSQRASKARSAPRIPGAPASPPPAPTAYFCLGDSFFFLKKNIIAIYFDFGLKKNNNFFFLSFFPSFFSFLPRRPGGAAGRPLSLLPQPGAAPSLARCPRGSEP